MKPITSSTASALILSTLLLGSCGKTDEITATTGDKTKNSVMSDSTSNVTKNTPYTPRKVVLEFSEEEAQVTDIKTTRLEEQVVNEQIFVTATIQANQNKLVRIAPRVPGRIFRVMANLGDKVRQGQPLALMDSIEMGEAQSAYAQAASDYELTKTNLERAERLYSDQIIPQKDYLRTRAESEKAKAVLRAADQKLKALGVESNKIGKVNPSVFALTAPFAGIVIQKDAVLGELAQPDRTLFSVADLSNVWIETNLFEKDLEKIKVGAPATVSVAAYPGEKFKGKVTYISALMDTESRTVKARVEVPNTNDLFKLGMFATAAIETGGSDKALLLPEESVVLIQGQPTIFIKTGNGYEARAVELGEKLPGHVKVKNGIKAGESVVTSGAYALKAKMLKSQISAD